MEKIGYPERYNITLPVAAAVLFSSTMLLSADAAQTQPPQPPSTQSELQPLVLEHEPVEPELSLSEEKLMFNRIMKEIRAEQDRLKQEAEARQKAIAASKLKSAKAKAPKTVSRNITSQVIDSSNQALINYALKFQGVPYKYGGTNPSTGLDCSAFTQLVFRNSGIKLPRTASMQFREGEGIARSGLQPGDLVFFSTNGPGASHVGIYIGDGMFISTTTKGVSIQDMNDNYWSKYYRGSRRVR